MCWQLLQQELEFLEVQEGYIKDEQKNLKKEYLHAQEEVKRIQSVPLVIGQFLEAIDQHTGIVGSTTGQWTAGPSRGRRGAVAETPRGGLGGNERICGFTAFSNRGSVLSLHYVLHSCKYNV